MTCSTKIQHRQRCQSDELQFSSGNSGSGKSRGSFAEHTKVDLRRNSRTTGHDRQISRAAYAYVVKLRIGCITLHSMGGDYAIALNHRRIQTNAATSNGISAPRFLRLSSDIPGGWSHFASHAVQGNPICPSPMRHAEIRGAGRPRAKLHTTRARGTCRFKTHTQKRYTCMALYRCQPSVRSSSNTR